MFTHLHLHTQYSLLDGACRIDELAKAAKDMGMKSLAITDHGNMYGAVAFYKACVKYGIKPIIGCEMYVSYTSRKERKVSPEGNYSHLILLCKNETGYKNLIKLVSLSYLEGYYYKPRIDHELLKKYHNGLVCLSACLAGEIPSLLLSGDSKGAAEKAKWFDELFGRGNFYLELQDHGLKDQKKVNSGLKQISRETGIPLVATNDVHYIKKEDARVQQILLCIATKQTLDEKGGFKFESDQNYLKSEDEMRELFPANPEAIENTNKIAEMCNFKFTFGQTKLPYFEVDTGETHFDYFKRLCFEGLVKRYGKNYPSEYEKRLNYELGIVDEMGYTDYYLIVSDFVHYAKSRGIPVGPGRGSGAGSIAAYCIGITNIDPMKYGLIFERFLNPERVSMPDFDIDFCYERRGEVIDYVTQKYGADHVAQIVTFGTMQTRAAIRDVGRVLGMPYSDVDRVAKAVPREFKITIDESLKKSEQLKKLYEGDPKIKELIDIAKSIEGMPRNTSTHAAGVVITHDKVSNLVPLAANDGVPVTQYIMTEIEELGLLKMDFLGLRTLTVIDNTAKECGIDIEKIPTDDEKVFQIFSSGQTEGVFQFESSGMKQMLKNLRPTKLEHLIAATSLYRPGPATEIDTFVYNSKHPDKIKYDTPLLEPILKDTFGTIVYQEQVMQIFRSLAGYSLGRADIVRRAMSKKKADVLLSERKTFVEGCKKNNIDENTANRIFDRMTDFAKYAFNKSHAACYALVAYQTAYLKCYFPAQFMAELLTSVLDSAAKISQYIAECKRLGFSLGVPSINKSGKGFTTDGKTITFGLLGIKGIGSDFIDEILKERQKGDFKDIIDFCTRLQTPHFNRRAIESLVKAGAFDGLGNSRRQIIQMLPAIISELEEYRSKAMYGQIGFMDMSGEKSEIVKIDWPDTPEFSKSDLLRMEKEVTGLYLSGHPIGRYEKYIKKLNYTNTHEIAESCQNTINPQLKDGDGLTVCGIIEAVSIKQTRQGQNMAFLTLEDFFGEIEIVVFHKVFVQCGDYLSSGKIVTVFGRLSLDDEGTGKILASKITGPPGPRTKPEPVLARSGGKYGGQKAKPAKDKPKSKNHGLYLKLKSRDDESLKKVKLLLEIFGGTEPVFFYFEDEKKYVRLKNHENTALNGTMLGELKRLLGENNVAVLK